MSPTAPAIMLSARDIPTDFVTDALGHSFCFTNEYLTQVENHQRSWEPLPDSLPVVKRAWEELANSYCRTVARLTNSRRISLADDGDASILVNALQDTVKTGIQDLSLRKSSKLWDPFTGGETQKGPTGKDLKYPVKTGIRDLSSCKSSDLWNPLTCGDTQKGPTGKDLKYRDALCSSLCKNYPGLATAFSFGKDPELQGRQLVKKLCGTEAPDYSPETFASLGSEICDLTVKIYNANTEDRHNVSKEDMRFCRGRSHLLTWHGYRALLEAAATTIQGAMKPGQSASETCRGEVSCYTHRIFLEAFGMKDFDENALLSNLGHPENLFSTDISGPDSYKS